MIGRSNIRLALTGALLLMLIGTVQGCSDQDPTAPEVPEAQASETATAAEGTCLWIGGVISCG